MALHGTRPSWKTIGTTFGELEQIEYNYFDSSRRVQKPSKIDEQRVADEALDQPI